MKHMILALATFSASILVAGCQTTPIAVTEQNPEAPTWKGGQSETATSVSNFNARSVITVAFNDDTPAGGKIQYTPTTRTVHADASLMGWSYSEDDGTSWNYGGNVKPSDDWPVLWGDPAIASSGSHSSTEGGSRNPVVRAIGRKLLMAGSLSV